MRPSTQASYEERILRAQFYLQNRLDDGVGLEELADVACLSPFHFHRIFRGMTGETVGACIRRLRLQRAATQLRTSGRPVTDVAFDAGYESLEGFSRAFSGHFGAPPSQWRETHATFPRSGESPEVHVVRRQATPALFVRHVGPYDAIGTAFSRLFQWAGRQGLLARPFEAAAMPYDDPEVTAPERIRADALLLFPNQPASTVPPPTGDVQFAVLSERDYAVVRHVGPYQDVGELYAWLCGVWLPSSGREAASAPPLEIYRNHPPQTPPPELVTDVCLPLEPSN